MSLISIFFLFLIPLSLSDPECWKGHNHCSKCHPLTNICTKCDQEIYTPNTEGGCSLSRTCTPLKQYCLNCDSSSTICSECVKGYFPDSNGGCSYSPNCDVALNGECIQCQEDYILIGDDDSLKMCLYMYSEEFSNCEEYSLKNGKCTLCKDGYYLNIEDKKCIEVPYCKRSTFGVCDSCQYGYYLDKRDDSCKSKDANNKFNHCKITLDGEVCEECEDNYFLSQTGICIVSNNCLNTDENNNFCITCNEGFYLTQSGYICSKDENCYYADEETGICTECIDDFYLTVKDGVCHSNKEDDNFKYCEKVIDDKCVVCESGYVSGLDGTCTNSKNCKLSKNNECISCIDNYYLGKDKKCTDVENCIYSDEYYQCIECGDNYFYNKSSLKCEKDNQNITDCKVSDYYGYHCAECKDNFYLNKSDQNCYSNTEDGDFYKCKYTTYSGDRCEKCADDYFLGFEDYLCSKVQNCAVLENRERCEICNKYFCLNAKTGECVDNYFGPETEQQKIFYQCNKTNIEATECEQCLEGFDLVNGLCYDSVDCFAKNDNGDCVMCNNVTFTDYYACLNKDYGCTESNLQYCLECQNSLNLDLCTKCKDGYELNEAGKCVIIDSGDEE